MKKLSLIGAGNVAKTLGTLLARTRCYQIADILCRSLDKGHLCRDFIDQGQVIVDVEALQCVDAIAILVSDDQLTQVVSRLSASHKDYSNTIVFHCSGAYSSDILSPLKSKGASIASIHPIKSFSHPAEDIHTFSGSYCALEGEALACQQLQQDFEAMGATVLTLTGQKMPYHIATIFSSNYVVTMLDTSLQLLEHAGVSREQGLTMLIPLLRGTLTLVEQRGTASALTGPIARGDLSLVAEQCAFLEKNFPDMASAYQALGKLTSALAEKKK